ncbi:phospholipase D-like domain-containing protein [Cytobacillus kochii]|uniref:phospholipase D-like domain-containing protein n=1 Tax=Cytobacillus kochii TaxID=859143 RepID=UPI001CD7750D|nr:phospholipase D-like domain-containing protein [Cytobacillus kochii]MCA1027792.1 phospholipase D-like domain-containing protein [Cytobacillus kochii]
MNLKVYTLDKLKDFIACGKGDGLFYFSGPQLVKLFESIGFEDMYSMSKGFVGNELYGGKKSRKEYVANRLKKINNSKKLTEFMEVFINAALIQIDQNTIEGSEEEVFIASLNKIIKSNSYSIEKIKDGYCVSGYDTYEEPVELKAYFEDIQNQIIEEIKKAKFTIWVAVAWFTDQILFNELIKKKTEGLNIQVIVIDDDTNRRYGFRFEDHFETYRFPEQGMFKNIMHNKFCVIDLEIVISGSYNWTKKAQYNHESMEIKRNRKLAETYAKKFIELKNLL